MSILEMTMKDLQGLTDEQLVELVHHASCEIKSRERKRVDDAQTKMLEAWTALKVAFPESKIRLEVAGKGHTHIEVGKVTIQPLRGA